jgi:polysulfide reductase chain C
MKRHLHAQEQWEWPIAVYLYLAGLGAGALAIGLLTDWLAHPNLPTRAVLLWGPLFVAVGAPFLILDLGKKKRFLNACLNPRSSWAARGFLILSTLIVAGLAVFAASFLPWALPILGLQSPAWLDGSLPVFRALEIVTIVFAFGTAAYTGVFLKSVKYVSLWNSWFLPVLFLVSALSTGSMGIIVALLSFGLAGQNDALRELSHSVMPVEQSLAVVEALVLILFMVLRHRVGQTGTESIRLLMRGRLRLVFWAGVVALGLLLPVILENLYSRFPHYPALLFVTGASLLAGGFFLRYGIVKGGIKDEHPLHKMVAMQYDWQATGPESGAYDDSEAPDV